MNKTNKKGFTLAELLIVVAIIAVLVAIAIPVFTAQLEKAREATDAANLRAAYAEIMAEAITNEGTTTTKTVTKTQKEAGWSSTSIKFAENFEVDAPTAAATGTWTITYDTTGATPKVKATLA